jgi:cell wall integrity and stress response component
MSNGNCTQHCRDEGGFAFAVIQYEDCYCSNLIPRQQTDVASCRKICPGFGAENCGSIDDGLFIYIQNGKPSGTAPGPSSAQPTTPTVSSSSPPPPPPPLPATTQAKSSSTPVTVSIPCLVELQALLVFFSPGLAHSAISLSCSCFS